MRRHTSDCRHRIAAVEQMVSHENLNRKDQRREEESRVWRKKGMRMNVTVYSVNKCKYVTE